MNNILSYIRDFFSRVDKWLLVGCALFAAALIVANYALGIETRRLYAIPAGWPRFAGFFALYAVAFIIPWLFLLYRIRSRRTSNHELRTPNAEPFRLPTPDSRFFFLLLSAPAIFALKVGFPGLSGLFAGRLLPPWDKYVTIIANLPARLLLVAFPLALLMRLEPRQPSFWGLTTRNFQWKPYALMLLAMVPLIAFASTQSDFLRTYPKLKQIAFIYPYVRHTGPSQLLFEISYGLDFLTIELFFRGFLVFAFVRYAGAEAIVPMAVFYCSIHFGKPLFECISSFFGGLLLGIVSYRTRSILGGFMVHVGIAWLMEIGGYVGSSLAGH